MQKGAANRCAGCAWAMNKNHFVINHHRERRPLSRICFADALQNQPS
jgi:hypothetical protein